jgi:hypothetical protein
MSKLFFLSDINPDSPTVRDTIREDVVDQYAESYRQKQPMPPIVVFADPKAKKYYLADGAHRCAAVALLGRKALEADVYEGSYADALQYALRANNTHGVQRSPADKRKCITAAIKQWPEEPNLSIAKRCDVDDKTVKAVRDELEAAKVVAPAPIRISAKGRKTPATRTSPVRNSEVADPVPEASPAPVVDKNGTPIPEGVQQYWKRSAEVIVLGAQINEVINSLRHADKEKDRLFAQCNLASAVADLDRVRTTIGYAMPYAVCTQCAGHPEAQPKGECRLCKGVGLISKFYWDRLVPEEVKAIIAKGKK